MSRTTTTVVVGAGHSGLATSHHLAARGVDHVVLERGQVAQSWRTQRWDSLRLLTPTWMAHLPGHDPLDDPDGFLSAGEFADHVASYAKHLAAPVIEDSPVTRISASAAGFLISTEYDEWLATSVVVAAGATRGVTPAVADALPDGIASLHAIDYRNPDQVADGGVLVVGAAASGVQIARELQAAGRPVTLAVGEHVRAPRRYRGRDIFRWIDEAGVLDERWDQVDDVVRARRLPSFQLVGGDVDVDLNALQAAGVRIVGKLAAIRDGRALFSGSLRNSCAMADLKLNRLLATIDAVAGGAGERPEPTRVPAPLLDLDLTSGEIRTVIWATGIKPDHGFIDLPVFDAKGQVRHDGGVTAQPGLYVTGLPVLRRRRSTYIAGADADAADLVAHLTGAQPVARPARLDA